MRFLIRIPCPFPPTSQCGQDSQIFVFTFQSVELETFGCRHVNRVDAIEVVSENYCEIAASKDRSGKRAIAGLYGVCQSYTWGLCGNCHSEIEYDDYGRSLCKNRCTDSSARRRLEMRGLLRRCDVCGSGCHMFPRGLKYAVIHRLLSNEIDHICSRKCCSLALAAILKNEREKRKTLKEIRCVQETRRVLSKFKKEMLKGQNPEVLKSLKREFEQAATLRS